MRNIDLTEDQRRVLLNAVEHSYLFVVLAADKDLALHQGNDVAIDQLRPAL